MGRNNKGWNIGEAATPVDKEVVHGFGTLKVVLSAVSTNYKVRLRISALFFFNKSIYRRLTPLESESKNSSHV